MVALGVVVLAVFSAPSQSAYVNETSGRQRRFLEIGAEDALKVRLENADITAVVTTTCEGTIGADNVGTTAKPVLMGGLYNPDVLTAGDDKVQYFSVSQEGHLLVDASGSTFTDPNLDDISTPNGHTAVVVQGWTEAAQTDAYTLVAPGNPDVSTFFIDENVDTAGVAITFDSDSNDDDATGSGARQVSCSGLATGTYAEQTINLAMGGTIAGTQSGTSFSRVWKCLVTASGTYAAANIGNITVGKGITTDDVTTPYLTIPAGDGSASAALWTVPAGQIAYLRNIYTAGGGSTQNCNIRCFTRTNADATPTSGTYDQATELIYLKNSGGASEWSPNSYIELSAKTDIWCDAKCTTAAAINVALDIIHMTAE